MKLSRLVLAAALIGTLAMFGCGSDDGGGSSGGGNTNGAGNTNGGGGPCDTGSCVNDANLRQACETAVAACELTLEGDPLQTCIAGAIADACTE